MQCKENTKKILELVLKIVTWLVVVFTVGMMIFTIVTISTVGRNDRSLFGFRFYIVQTDSMRPSENNVDFDIHFNAGDIVLIKNVEDSTVLQAGDVIAFMSTNSVSYGETVTHAIREVKINSVGKVLGYVTYGTNTGTNDEALVEPEYVLGKYAGKLPGVGNFFAFLKTTPGYIVCILVPFLLIIGYNGVNFIRLILGYRKEQKAEIQAERDQIAVERQQAAEMLKELQELKAQLAQKEEGDNPSVPPEGATAPFTQESQE